MSTITIKRHVDNTFVRESPDHPDRVQLVDDYTGDVLLEREHGDHAALLEEMNR